MSEPHPQPLQQSAPTKRARAGQLRITAAVGLVAVIGVGGWLAVRHHRSGTASNATAAVAVSAQGLNTVAHSLGQPIYWAGARPGVTYELTHASDGRTYVRYLPPGVPVGVGKLYLTVATYPFVGAFAGTSKVAHQPGSVRVPVNRGAIAFYSTAHPTSVYEAWQGVDYQVEVYSPSPAQARLLVRQGLIRAVGPTAKASAATSSAASAQTAAVAASPSDLRNLERKLGRSVYWAGGEPRVTYELTQSAGGRVYIRYLPGGVTLGSSQPYLTVATYPYKGAYAATNASASEPGSVQVNVAGGVAYYTNAKPTSVYVAFKGTDEQIEVFDAVPARARALVAAGKIKPVA